MKDQLDVTCYFISLLMHSTCFGHYYIHHQELATVLTARVVLFRGALCDEKTGHSFVARHGHI